MSCNCRIRKLLSLKTVRGVDRARRQPSVEIADVFIRGMNCRTSDSRFWIAHVLPRLHDIPVLDQNPILHDENVGRYPTGWSAETGKASVDDHEIALGYDHVVLVLQRVRKTLDKSEESVASRSNVGTVLNVIRRPESFRRRVIALIEQGFERFQNDGLILRCC